MHDKIAVPLQSHSGLLIVKFGYILKQPLLGMGDSPTSSR